MFFVKWCIYPFIPSLVPIEFQDEDLVFDINHLIINCIVFGILRVYVHLESPWGVGDIFVLVVFILIVLRIGELSSLLKEKRKIKCET